MDSLATPPPRSRKEMERRRDARLAAQRLAREKGGNSMRMSFSQPVVDYHMPYEVIRPFDRSLPLSSDSSALGDRASGSTSQRLRFKLAGKPLDPALSAKASSASSSDLESSYSPSSDSDSGDSSVLPPAEEQQSQSQSMEAPESVKQQFKAPPVPPMPKTIFKPHGRLPLAQQKKDYFERVWNDQNLGFHMPAQDLADSVKMMSAAGLDSHTAKAYIASKLKDAPSQAYRDAYADRARQWASAVGNARRDLLLHDDDFASLDQRTQQMRVYQRAKKTIVHNRLRLSQARIAAGLAKEEPRYGRKKQKMETRNLLLEEIGIAFRKHLANNKMDFDTMTPEQLEVQTRELGHPNVSPKVYQKYIVDYIAQHRPGGEVRRYRDERTKYNCRKSNRKRDRRGASGY